MSTATAGEPGTTFALLHLASKPGEVGHNKLLIESAARRASAMGAKTIITPELAVSGYGFRDVIGTDWIMREQPSLLSWASELARQLSAFLILGTPESDAALFNSMIVFAPDGTRIGQHRKVLVLKSGAESWSTAGDRATVVTMTAVGRAGLFVCADVYSKRLVDETVAQGPDLLLSSAAWAPGFHGPNGEWERASIAAQRPLLVCNRTGRDVLDFREAQSAVVVAGKARFSHSSPDSALILVDWSPRSHQVSNWRLA